MKARPPEAGIAHPTTFCGMSLPKRMWNLNSGGVGGIGHRELQKLSDRKQPPGGQGREAPRERRGADLYKGPCQGVVGSPSACGCPLPQLQRGGLGSPAPLTTRMASDFAELREATKRPPPRACMVLPLGSRACAFLHSHGNSQARQATPFRSTTTCPQAMRPTGNQGYRPGAAKN